MMKKSIALLLMLALVLSLAACGNSNDSDTSGDGGAAAGNDLVIAFNTDIQQLDPHNTTDTLSISVSRTMYEGLVTFDDDQNVVGLLAEDFHAEDDNLTYTFKLREDVKFHDGEEFNADAVVANYDRIMADSSLRQYTRVNTWDSVTKTGDYEVQIKLKEPHSSFLNQLTQVQFVSPAALEDPAQLQRTAAGTGAFVYDSRIEGDHVKVVPFADYWGGAPAVDSLTFKATPEDGARVAMLQTGEADFIYPMPAIRAEQIDGTDDIEVIAKPSNIMRYVTLNTRIDELSDKRVRQAMNHAINKEAYIKTVFNGYASEVYSVYPSTVSYYSEQTPYDYDVEKALALMADAGYEDGFKISIWGDNITSDQTGMQFVQQQLKLINIDLDVMPMEPSTIGDMIYVPEEEATINTWYVNWSASSFDADGSMRNILHKDMIPPTSANTAYFENERFSELLDLGRATTDTEELAEIYAEAQAIAWEEAPWLFLGSDQVIAGQKTYVSGITLRPDGSIVVKDPALSK